MIAITAPNVLIVDDQRDTLDMLSDALGAEGMMTTPAADGRSALSSIARHQPDIVQFAGT